jgi:hypothetical protein
MPNTDLEDAINLADRLTKGHNWDDQPKVKHPVFGAGYLLYSRSPVVKDYPNYVWFALQERSLGTIAVIAVNAVDLFKYNPELRNWQPKPKLRLGEEPEGWGRIVSVERTKGDKFYKAGTVSDFIRVMPGYDREDKDRRWFMVTAPRNKNKGGEVAKRWYSWEELNEL